MSERRHKRNTSRAAGTLKGSSRAMNDARTGRGPADEQGIFQLKAIWICLALIAATVIVYAPVRHFDFVEWDDPIYVKENLHVAAGLTWQSIEWAFTTTHAGYWMPSVWLSYLVDRQWSGLDAGGFHVTNVLFHIANTILLFGLFYRMTGALGRSGVVAGLFALHPLHVESVAWVTERKDVLSAFFGILAMWTYVAWVRRPGWKRYIAILALFALALAAKPMLITLPLMLLLIDFWPLGRVPAGAGPSQRAAWLRLFREKVPLFVLALASGVVTFLAQRSAGAVGDLQALPFSYRVENALLSYATYIGDMLWPVGLAAFYPLPKSLAGFAVFCSVLALAAGSVLTMRAARRHPYLAAGWLWYLGTLVPVIGLVQAGQQARADRFTYVPLIGLFWIVAWGIPDLLGRWPARRVQLAVAACLTLLGCAFTASAQVQYWRDSASLWTHAVEVTTDNAVAHNNLARALLEEGKFNEAVTQFTTALRIAPENADAHNNFANALTHHGREAEALAQYAEALRIRPDFAEAHNNFANALMRQGKLAEAVTQYSEALRIKHDYADAHNGLGAVLARQGNVAEALEHYSEALRSDPSLADVHNNMGALLVDQGKTDEAIREFSEAARINPSKAAFHYNLGVMFRKKGQIEEARKEFDAALKLDSSYQQARQALASLPSAENPPRSPNR